MSTNKSLAIAFRFRVLNFWFSKNRWTNDGNRPEISTASEPIDLKRWFGSSKEFDREIKEKFEDDLTRLMNDEFRYENDRNEPEHLLACVIALDQFPRNIFRNDSKAFAFDSKAKQISNELIENQLDQRLPYVERTFVYLPFEHSENLDDQNRSVQAFEKLLAQANADTTTSEELRQFLGFFVKFSREHRQIIERFGRFPHRNLVLQRKQTEEEDKYLNEGGQRFGQ